MTSRAQLRDHFAAARITGVDRFEPVGHVHETADPEVVIYEFSYVGEARGESFAIPCLFVTRVRDGHIVESRDYADHLAQARVFGRLSALVAALS